MRLAGEDVTVWKPHRRSARGMCHVPEGRGVYRRPVGPRQPDHAGAEGLRSARPSAGRSTPSRSWATGSTSWPGTLQRWPATDARDGRGPRARSAAAPRRRRRPLGLGPIVVDEIFSFLERCTALGASLLLVDQFVHRALTMATTSASSTAGGSRSRSGRRGCRAEADLFEQYLVQRRLTRGSEAVRPATAWRCRGRRAGACRGDGARELASATIVCPFTMTWSTPRVRVSRPASPGRSNHVRTSPGPTVASSNTTRSACWAPSVSRPRHAGRTGRRAPRSAGGRPPRW